MPASPPRSRARRGWRPALGPILLFRGVQEERWRVSALFAAEDEAEPPDLGAEGVLLPIPPRHVGTVGGLTLWRFDFAVAREAADRRVLYGFPSGERWWFQVPARDGRLRIAALADGAGPPPGGPWSRLNGAHRANPFHLMLRAGGQADARAVWTAGPILAAWSARAWRERAALPFTAEMTAEAGATLADCYLRAWRRPELAALHASVPSAMAPGTADRGEDWDALPAELAASPVVRGVLAEADRAAACLQAGSPEVGDQPGSGWDLAAGGVGLLGLTVRRGPDPLIEPAWRGLPARLDRLVDNRLLLVICAPPPLEPRIGGIGALLRSSTRIEGSWRSEARETGWMRLLRLLGDHAHRSGARIALVGGGWGLGSLATLRGPDHEIWQVSLPAMDGAVPAPRAETLERAGRTAEIVRDGLELSFSDFPEADGRRFLAGRGWASLETDRTGDLLAEWVVEGAAGPLIRWIPAVSPAS
ncbi:hypothetical protein [Arenibaculum pallidiluteum]|uniref:hypothetical protein n=1 Tax=Arenibaculum pallidiluteum TaxID=2812559 RepID=UPI001A967F21|nr:hypothetical protein [Arenibaculum pallidiluteum]